MIVTFGGEPACDDLDISNHFDLKGTLSRRVYRSAFDAYCVRRGFEDAAYCESYPRLFPGEGMQVR